MRHVPMLLGAAAIFGVLSASSASDRAAPGQEAIGQMLISPSGWSVFRERTQSDTPSDRASRLAYQFFRRGSAIVGRTTNMVANMNCEFEVVVRDNGVDLGRLARSCLDLPDSSVLQLEYDPTDHRFPFKNTAVAAALVDEPNS